MTCAAAFPYSPWQSRPSRCSPMTIAACVTGLCSLLLATSGEPESWLDFLTRGGLLGGAVIAIYALLTEKVVPGSRYRRDINERDALIRRLTTALEKSSRGIERVAETFFPVPEEKQ